jgi:D-proline reductase (dithiol) PrdB
MGYETVAVADVKRLHHEWQERLANAHHGCVHYNSTGAFNRPRKPMCDATVALATTSGVHLVGQEPFDMFNHKGDQTVRLIPGDSAVSDLRFTHDHYDHTDADRDPNCIFPLQRLRELQASGTIGSVAPIHASASGFMPDPRPFLENAVLDVIERFRKARVDVVLLTGG